MTDPLAVTLEQAIAEIRLIVGEMRREDVMGWPNGVESLADQLAAVLAAQEKPNDATE